MHVVDYFEVYDDFSVDGMNPIYNTLCNFLCEKDAFTYAKGKGNYGRNAQVAHRVKFICDRLDEATEYDMNQKKQNALNKLTAEERKLLGL